LAPVAVFAYRVTREDGGRETSEYVQTPILITASEAVGRFPSTAGELIVFFIAAVEEIITLMNIPAIELVRALVGVTAVIRVDLSTITTGEVVGFLAIAGVGHPAVEPVAALVHM